MIVRLQDGVTGDMLEVPASQVVVYNNQGTPIAAAAEFGTTRSQKVSRVGDDTFEEFVRSLGYSGDLEITMPDGVGGGY